MKKRQSYLLGICFVLLAGNGAAQMTSGKGGALQVDNGNPNRIAPITSPFGFSLAYAPSVMQKFDICAVVDKISDGKPVTLEVVDSDKAVSKRTYLEFRVRVLSCNSLKEGKEYRCIAPKSEPYKVPDTYKRFLVLGWKSKDSVLATDFDRQQSFASRSAGSTSKVKEDTLFIGCMIPTQCEEAYSAKSSLDKAYLNLAKALSQGTDISSVRRITSMWSMVKPDSLDRVDGVPIRTWMIGLTGPFLQKRTPLNPVEKLRIGGLLADWYKPVGTLDYMRALPATLKKAQVKENIVADHDKQEDLHFLKNLLLCSSADPDTIVDLALSDPALTFLLFDPSMGKPSVEAQTRMLSLLDSTDLDTRVKAYVMYANWYGKRDWVLDTTKKWSSSGYYIPNEDEMYKHWHQQFGVPITP